MASPSKQPVVLITGASRGLGLSVAKLLLTGTSALDTANVVTLSRTKTAELEQLSKQADGPTSLVAVQGDVTSKADNERAVQTAIERFGRLDGVILNAGALKVSKLADFDPDVFAEQINILCNSLITTLHYAIPHLRASPTGCGKIVLVSSGAAVKGTAGWGAYNAGKAAMNSIAKTLANEEDKLAVVAIRPGMVDTDMQALIRSAQSKSSMHAHEHDVFPQAHKDGKLLPPHLPGHVLAALAVKATRSHPREDAKSEVGAGAVGSFLNWNADELQEFQFPGEK